MRVLLLFVLCAVVGLAHESLPDKIDYVLENQDKNLGLKLYNEISDADLSQLEDSSLFDYHYFGAWLCAELDNYNKALSHLLKAKELCDRSLGTYSIRYMDVMRGLGDEYIRRGEYEEALAVCQEGIVKSMAIREAASHAFANLIMCVQECYERMGWLNEIPLHLSDAWSFWPKDEEPFATYNYFPLWNLQQFYRRYGDYDKALQVSDTIICFISEKVGQNHTEIAEACYMKGNILVAMGRNLDAVEVYKHGLNILKLNREEANYLYRLISGNMLLAVIPTEKCAECDSILADIEKYGKDAADPDIYKNALYSAANRFAECGDYKKALALNNELLGLELPEDERKTVESQATSIIHNRDVTDAMPQLEGAFCELPTGSVEWFETGRKLSSAYYLKKERERNLGVLGKMYGAIKENPSAGEDYYFWVLCNLYGCCFEIKDYDKALRFAKEKNDYLHQIPDVPEIDLYYALSNLVVSKLKSDILDNVDEEMDDLETSCLRLFGSESDEFALYLHNRGCAYRLQGKLEEAKRCLLSAIALQNKLDGTPESSTVQYLMDLETQIADEELDF